MPRSFSASATAALQLKVPWLADLLLKRGTDSRTIVFAETNARVAPFDAVELDVPSFFAFPNER